MIPEFPSFKSIELTDRHEVEVLLRLHPPYSDFNFASLWCYDTHGICRLSMLHGNLVAQISDYITGEPRLSFFGMNCVEDTTDKLLDHAVKLGMRPTLRPVPELGVTPLMTINDGFVVVEDEDSFDYIYPVERLIALDHPTLRAKQRKIEKLRLEHPDLEIRRLSLGESQTTVEIRGLCERWRKGKGRSNIEFETERTAIERCLSSATYFGLVGLGAMLDGALAGFTINEPIHNGYYMAHFGKCDPRWGGARRSAGIRDCATHA